MSTDALVTDAHGTGLRRATRDDLIGLPAEVAPLYYTNKWRGDMYTWQAECLMMEGVLQGRNLVRDLFAVLQRYRSL